MDKPWQELNAFERAGYSEADSCEYMELCKRFNIDERTMLNILHGFKTRYEERYKVVFNKYFRRE
jgi:sulfatase maturation enzyme AslB (radical SAM superfamily)